MKVAPRVALFTDSFHELNGVGTVSREFLSYAKSRTLPFCCVYGGPETVVATEGSAKTVQLKRGFLSFPLDKELYCDPLLNRYLNRVVEELAAFKPDLIQITSPGDMGILGFWVSHRLGVPMAASWHTNLHEYCGRRIYKALRHAPRAIQEGGSGAAEHWSLKALIAYYRLAHFVLAPNQTMVDLLRASTGRPAFPMKHGVDSNRFHPGSRAQAGREFCIGWVGRLTPEKNVREFVRLESQLLDAGERNFRMLIVGDGSERKWLETHLKNASLPGALQGEALVSAFASMDAFVFPSRTDTFGLVILEALATGVPVLLGREASERVGLQDRVQGFVTDDFFHGIRELMHCEPLRQSMGASAQLLARSQSWKIAFDSLYDTYAEALENDEVRRRIRKQVQPELVSHPVLSSQGSGLEER